MAETPYQESPSTDSTSVSEESSYFATDAPQPLAPTLAPTPAARPPRRQGRRLVGFLIGLITVLLLVAIAVMMVRPERLLGGRQFKLSNRGTLAVLPFENATGESAQAWVSHGLAPMLAEVIDAVPGLEVVSPDTVSQALDSSHRLLVASDAPSEAWPRVRMAAIGVDVVLEARVERSRNGYRIKAALHETTAAQGTNPASGDPDQDDVEWLIFAGETVLAAAEKLATRVVQALDPDALAPDFARVYTGRHFLDRLYGTARYVLNQEGAEKAAPFFESLLTLEPRFLAARIGRAKCAQERGDLESARQEWLEVLRSGQGVDDHGHQAVTLAALATIATLDGRADEAEELHLQAQSMLSSRGDRRGQADVLESRARLALSERNVDRAEALFLEILEHREAVGDQLGRAATLLEVGALRLNASDLDGADALFSDARGIAKKIDDLEIEMSAVAALGDIAARRGDAETADSLWGEALVYDRRRGESQRALMLSARRAELAYSRRDLDSAERLYGDALELSKGAGDVRLEARSSLRLASILLAQGYAFQARPHFERALELDRELDDPFALQRVIARLAYEQRDFGLAASSQEALRSMIGDGWSESDQALLDAYRQAIETGHRQPLPDDPG